MVGQLVMTLVKKDIWEVCVKNAIILILKEMVNTLGTNSNRIVNNAKNYQKG